MMALDERYAILQYFFVLCGKEREIEVLFDIMLFSVFYSMKKKQFFETASTEIHEDML